VGALMPIRVQRSRAKGWRMPANTVYVGRPTIWGNPFFEASHFRAWLNGEMGGNGRGGGLRRLTILARAHELRGKDLACWCAPDRECHADVLLELANAEAR